MSADRRRSPAKQASTQVKGRVQVEPLLCKSCGLCAEYCPQNLMTPASDLPPEERDGPVINPAGHVVYVIHDPKGQCTGCGICASACPEGAVVVYRRRPKPSSASEPRPEGRGPTTNEQTAASQTDSEKPDA